MRDVLRLSRAMTFKAAVAGLPLGGGKGVIMLQPDDGGAVPRAPRGRAARLRRHRRGAGRRLPDRRGRRHVRAGHGDDRRAHAPRHRPGRGPRRLGRPEPVDGARLPRRAAGDRRARAGHGDLAGRSVSVVGLGHVGGRLAELLRRGRGAARGGRRRPAQARAGRAARRPLDRPGRRADRRGRPARALRAGRRAQRRDRARAALPRGGRRGQQPARRRQPGRRAGARAGSCGRRTSSATPAGSSTSRSSSSPAATRPSAPTPGCARSATRCATSSRAPRRRTRRRSPRPWSSAAPGSPARAPSSRRPSAPLRAASPGARAGSAPRTPHSRRGVGPGRVEQGVLDPHAGVQRRDELALALGPVARYSSSLRGRVVTIVAVAGVEHPQRRARAAGAARPGTRAARPETNTLPSPSTASPVNAAAPAHEHEVVVGVAGHRQRPRAARTRRRRRAPRRRRAAAASGAPSRVAPARRAPSEWSAWSCVSAMPPAPPRRCHLGRHRSDVRGQCRARVDHPGRVAAVRPRCSCRSGSAGSGCPPHAGESSAASVSRFTSRYTGPFSDVSVDAAGGVLAERRQPGHGQRGLVHRARRPARSRVHCDPPAAVVAVHVAPAQAAGSRGSRTT